ncbi:MAG TPA: AraC family transcriptional regulator [Mizugakiibacter sp.]|nr:AraC family transcriptional regulator [Mizugakiibacter sp.]
MKQLNSAGDNRHHIGHQRIMLLTPDRVFYLGLLGAPSLRKCGALMLYASLDSPFSLCLDGGHWAQRELAVVPPHVCHRIITNAPMIASIMIEPESVNLTRLPDVFTGPSCDETATLNRIREAYACLQTIDYEPRVKTLDVDCLFWGRALAPRALDARVAAIINKIRHDPTGHYSACACAAESGLSFSHFLHLFKQETGVAFRKFQAWKRARAMLYHVNRRDALIDIALDVGYPDSTHFSHTIRQVYGLPPREIFAGSRHLMILRQEPLRTDAWQRSLAAA